MPTSLKQMIDAANAAVPRITPPEARELIGRGALVVDVRDAPEIAKTGWLQGAQLVSRGMLEFRADPASPAHDRQFDPARPVILYCASGGRAALAGHTLQQLGYAQVFNLGAFKDWVEAGGAIDTPIEPGM